MTDQQSTILLVMRPGHELRDILDSHIKQVSAQSDFPNPAKVISAVTAIEGLMLYKEHNPCLTIISADLPDMSGMSLSTIIKDNAISGRKNYVYLVDVESLMLNTKADLLYHKSFDITMLSLMLRAYIEDLSKGIYHDNEIMESRELQKSYIPRRFENSNIAVDNIFSPFSQHGLSGDGIDYWMDEASSRFCGMIYDCTGHDLPAFMNTSTIRTLIKVHAKQYISSTRNQDIPLSEIFASVNSDLFSCYAVERPMAAGVIFILDLKKKELQYCSSGVVCFYARARDTGHIQRIEMSGSYLGWDREAEYTAGKIGTENLSELIFCSDGFSDLVYDEDEYGSSPIESSAKHDDVSVVIIHLKDRQSQQLQHEYDEEPFM